MSMSTSKAQALQDGLKLIEERYGKVLYYDEPLSAGISTLYDVLIVNEKDTAENCPLCNAAVLRDCIFRSTLYTREELPGQYIIREWIIACRFCLEKIGWQSNILEGLLCANDSPCNAQHLTQKLR